MTDTTAPTRPGAGPGAVEVAEFTFDNQHCWVDPAAIWADLNPLQQGAWPTGTPWPRTTSDWADVSFCLESDGLGPLPLETVAHASPSCGCGNPSFDDFTRTAGRLLERLPVPGPSWSGLYDNGDPDHPALLLSSWEVDLDDILRAADVRPTRVRLASDTATGSCWVTVASARVERRFTVEKVTGELRCKLVMLSRHNAVGGEPTVDVRTLNTLDDDQVRMLNAAYLNSHGMTVAGHPVIHSPYRQLRDALADAGLWDGPASRHQAAATLLPTWRGSVVDLGAVLAATEIRTD